MPWCPKCKQEFQKEITVCPDCNEPLVEALDDSVMTEIDFFSEEAAEKFVSFLEYSNIQNASLEKDTTLDLYHIKCKEDDLAEVNKLFQAYKSVEEEEADEVEEEEKEEVAQEEAKSSTPYVKVKDQYADASSTGVMLVVIGILGLVYVALNYAGTLSLLNGVIPYVLNLVLFTAAIIYGIISLYNADKLKAQIGEEEALRKEIMEWMTETVTEEVLKKASDPELPQEANYLKQFQAVKDLVVDKYPDVKENFIESLVEEKLSAE